MRSSSAREVWRAVLGDLQMQLPRPTFETWLKPTEGVALSSDADGEQVFVVEAPTPFAVEWLERRMFHALQNTLEKVAGHPVQLHLQVRSEGISYAVPPRYDEKAELPSGVTPGSQSAAVRVPLAESQVYLRHLRRRPVQPAGIQRGPSRGRGSRRGLQPPVPLLRGRSGQDPPVAGHRPAPAPIGECRCCM